MIQYVAFLRGINVGGHTRVEMAKLREVFEDLGCNEVKTLLNSGNVVFQTSELDKDQLTAAIEKKLQENFGFSIPVLLRSGAEIQTLIDSDPFKDIKITPQTRCLVTFLPDDTQKCNVVEITPGHGTPELMNSLERQFGKRITTRTWNTVTKLAALIK